MINVDNLLSQQMPKLEQIPKLKRTVSQICKKILHEDEINGFLTKHEHLGANEFLDEVMHRLGLSYVVDNWQLENIPTEGKVVIVANHPLGSLDGIALLKLVSQVRSDIKIVTNQILNHLEPLKSFFLPVNNMAGTPSKTQYSAIEQALKSGQAVIFFPAGEVSRYRLSGIRDCHWRSGFLHLAKKTQAPILPIHVGGKNSKFFYGLSLIAKPISILLLVKEMFRKARVTLPITIGEMIPYHAIDSLPPNHKVAAQLFRKHVYALSNGKKLVFDTEKPIAHPQPRRLLKTELENCPLLSTTKDGKQIFLLENAKDTSLLSEIGRLREISFRAVGEGTGLRVDIDEFDTLYQHIVLWDPKVLEIVGAYRVIQTKEIPLEKIYSSTLFDYQLAFVDIKKRGLELGRSFVQPKYWGKRSLDYLWYGIGAYLTRHPEVRYLFGPVSISAEYSKSLMEWLVYFYGNFYPTKEDYATAKNPFHPTADSAVALEQTFENCNLRDSFKQLKYQLKSFNKTVPTLLKQYTELCEEGGVGFATFNIDPKFNNCVDGLVIVDMQRLLPKKRSKYMPYSEKVNYKLSKEN
ncbi:lysophospholipid acyltransferase family protein [Aliikangiella coralliicola]|uniref:L-ornithine N(alpha)-acyltransferase n=1 Tax=Aliikangiella coralliicola TaxID=2592383 RepID=A0A545UFD9_9GAMM|nr:lysophospholipid acyltransferase family protein [Aliikangiella coralliicola]TQV88196.1 lysophospholipid acyltransferase family protein [Aliikangiella coralliicola]